MESTTSRRIAMQETGSRMMTFVVRVWVETTPSATDGDRLRGVVEHVGTGGSATFIDGAELIALLHELSRGRAGQTGGTP